MSLHRPVLGKTYLSGSQGLKAEGLKASLVFQREREYRRVGIKEALTICPPNPSEINPVFDPARGINQSAAISQPDKAVCQ